MRLDDGGGYRPQLGQRPNMGFGQVMELRELIDFRTRYIASDPGTYFGGGTLGVQDLTLGLEELSFTDKGFPTRRTPRSAAAAHTGVAGTGVYRSPTPLPDGRILVAYSPCRVDLGDRRRRRTTGCGWWIPTASRPRGSCSTPRATSISSRWWRSSDLGPPAQPDPAGRRPARRVRLPLGSVVRAVAQRPQPGHHCPMTP